VDPEDRAVRINSPVGQTLPLHATAAGKTHLAFDTDEQLKSSLPDVLRAYTDRTITDRALLFAQLESVARSGYAVDSGEYLDEVSSVAVPIRDYTRSVVGSLSVSGPAYRIPEDRVAAEIAPLILDAGRELSHRLGYNE
jgi:IclR family transcriptional regulator, KDG regulon repressor